MPDQDFPEQVSVKNDKILLPPGRERHSLINVTAGTDPTLRLLSGAVQQLKLLPKGTPLSPSLRGDPPYFCSQISTSVSFAVFQIVAQTAPNSQGKYILETDYVFCRIYTLLQNKRRRCFRAPPPPHRSFEN